MANQYKANTNTTRDVTSTYAITTNLGWESSASKLEFTPISPLNRVTIQLNGQEITPEIISDPEIRKQKVQLVIRNGLTLVTLESPSEIENMRSLAKTLLDWANAIEQSEATNTLTGNG